MLKKTCAIDPPGNPCRPTKTAPHLRTRRQARTSITHGKQAAVRDNSPFQLHSLLLEPSLRTRAGLAAHPIPSDANSLHVLPMVARAPEVEAARAVWGAVSR